MNVADGVAVPCMPFFPFEAWTIDLSTAYLAIVVATLVLVVSWHWRTALGCQPLKNVPLLPGGKPLIGHAVEILTNQHRFHDWILEGCRAQGYKTYAFTVPLQPTWFVVTDPTCLEYVLRTEMHNFVKGSTVRRNYGPLLGHGIFTSDGEQWLWQRKLATHIFTVKSFKRYINIVFSDKMDLLTGRLSESAASASPIDLHDLLYRFTLDSFGQIGFGVDPGSLTCKGKVAFAQAFDKAQMITVERYTNPFWQLTELLTGRRKVLNNSCSIIKAFAMDIINKRRQLAAAAAMVAEQKSAAAAAAAGEDADDDGTSVRDLLSLFMQAVGPGGKPLTDRQLVDTVTNFIIAGRDTTAQALSWTFYELLHHPEVEAKLLQELRDVLGPGCTAPGAAVKPTYDQIRALQYTRACFLEALRLHPSVSADLKFVVKADTLPDGSVIPKGAQVLYPPYAVNRRPDFWGPDADEFRPGRWLELASMPSPYSYLSFNAGPRLCLGQRLAEIEGVYVLAGLLARFRLRQEVPGSKVNYVFSASLPMKEGLQVLVEQREL